MSKDVNRAATIDFKLHLLVHKTVDVIIIQTRLVVRNKSSPIDCGPDCRLVALHSVCSSFILPIEQSDSFVIVQTTLIQFQKDAT
jgi:hypothetical protein